MLRSISATNTLIKPLKQKQILEKLAEKVEKQQRKTMPKSETQPSQLIKVRKPFYYFTRDKILPMKEEKKQRLMTEGPKYSFINNKGMDEGLLTSRIPKIKLTQLESNYRDLRKTQYQKNELSHRSSQSSRFPLMQKDTSGFRNRTSYNTLGIIKRQKNSLTNKRPGVFIKHGDIKNLVGAIDTTSNRLSKINNIAKSQTIKTILSHLQKRIQNKQRFSGISSIVPTNQNGLLQPWDNPLFTPRDDIEIQQHVSSQSKIQTILEDQLKHFFHNLNYEQIQQKVKVIMTSNPYQQNFRKRINSLMVLQRQPILSKNPKQYRQNKSIQFTGQQFHLNLSKLKGAQPFKAKINVVQQINLRRQNSNKNKQIQLNHSTLTQQSFDSFSQKQGVQGNTSRLDQIDIHLGVLEQILEQNQNNSRIVNKNFQSNKSKWNGNANNLTNHVRSRSKVMTTQLPNLSNIARKTGQSFRSNINNNIKPILTSQSNLRKTVIEKRTINERKSEINEQNYSEFSLKRMSKKRKKILRFGQGLLNDKGGVDKIKEQLQQIKSKGKGRRVGKILKKPSRKMPRNKSQLQQNRYDPYIKYKKQKIMIPYVYVENQKYIRVNEPISMKNWTLQGARKQIISLVAQSKYTPQLVQFHNQMLQNFSRFQKSRKGSIFPQLPMPEQLNTIHRTFDNIYDVLFQRELPINYVDISQTNKQNFLYDCYYQNQLFKRIDDQNSDNQQDQQLIFEKAMNKIKKLYRTSNIQQLKDLEQIFQMKQNTLTDQGQFSAYHIYPNLM